MRDSSNRRGRSARNIAVGREAVRACIEALEDRRMLSASMVKDINTTLATGWVSSSPVGLHVVDGTAYFIADDGVHGDELWKTDGTAAGTAMVKEIEPGSDGAYFSGLTSANGSVFFIADRLTYGKDLWKSDGSEAGTVPIQASGEYAPYTYSDTNPVAVGGTVYFVAKDWYFGEELWRTDGTDAGTVLVKDIYPGSEDSSHWGDTNDYSPGDLTAYQGFLYFTADDGEHGRELWKTDGTEAGTVLVKDINPGTYYDYDVDEELPYDSMPGELTVVGDTLYFVAEDREHGRELWKSNGTEAGTVLVKDINPEQDEGWLGDLTGYGSNPSGLTAVNGTLYFAASGQLWKSDGTEAGTVMVAQVPGKGGKVAAKPQITVASGLIYFIGQDDEHGRELWKTDGTAAGTGLVKDIYTGFTVDSWGQKETPNGSSPENLVAYGGSVVFNAYDPVHGRTLWKTDGSEAGAVVVSEGLQVGDPGSADDDEEELSFSNVVILNGRMLFAGDDAIHGIELLASDGTSAGTKLVRDIEPEYLTMGSAPEQIVELNGVAYFVASGDADYTAELWRSDGTAGGTVRVKKIPDYGWDGHEIMDLTSFEGKLIFSARSDPMHDELWISDGTEAGTVRLKDIPLGNYGYISTLADINGTLYFGVYGENQESSLWRTDGTEAGTVRVKNLREANNVSPVLPEAFAALPDGTVVFTVTGGWPGLQIWRTDGTEEGTVRLMNAERGNENDIAALVTIGNAAFFAANDGVHGEELWKTDGTVAGTVMVKDISAAGRYGSRAGSSPDNLVALNGMLYFSANDGIHGNELWKSDGTEAGTVLVKDLSPGTYYDEVEEEEFPYGSMFWGLTNINGTLFFGAQGYESGCVLWKSDGTEAGTVPLKNLWRPWGFTDVNGLVYFSADDGEHGNELWQSDGTKAGTVLVADLWPGTTYMQGAYDNWYEVNSSDPGSLIGINGVLFFAASDNVYGYELWTYTPSPAATDRNYIVRLDAGGTNIEVADAVTGDVIRTVKRDSMEALVIAGTDGKDYVTIDLSRGMPATLGGGAV